MAEKERISQKKQELSEIRKIKNAEDREAKLAEFNRLDQSAESLAGLPNPVLYPINVIGNEDDDDSSPTGIPQFKLVIRVDVQGKFGKEKSVMAFQNSFGNLRARLCGHMLTKSFAAVDNGTWK